MLKKIVLIFVIIMLTGGCSFSSKQTSQDLDEIRRVHFAFKQDIPTNFVPKDLHIVAVGDSLTEGVGDSTHNGGYLAYLEGMLKKEKGVNNVDVSNYGKKGDKTTDLIKKLNKDEIKEDIQDADLIMITIGGNDLMKVFRDNIFKLSYPLFKNPEQKFEERLDTIISTIRSDNDHATITLVGLYNPFSEWFQSDDDIKHILNDWNNGSQTVLQKYHHTVYIKVDDIFENNEDVLLYKDKFHPNNLGYKLIAKRIYHEIVAEQIFQGDVDHLVLENSVKEE
jgi:lysophospholipase L1-like esterase